MSTRRTTLSARAAWAALASAGVAAAIAAVAASVFADAVVQRGLDRRLSAAASELVHELDSASAARSLDAIVREEQDEVAVSGVRLVVYGPTGTRLAGDAAVPRGDGCRTRDELRSCGVLASNGNVVVAAGLRETNTGLLALAAAAAAAIAALVAWLIARALSRRAVAPLVRLRSRIADLPLDATSSLPPIDLGTDEGVSEVDDLRSALRVLLTRMRESLDHSSRFAANAAHELRTPLTSLRAELELLAEHPAEGADSLATALRKVDQLQTLTERLLLLATPRENTETFELLSLRDVIDDVLADLTESERERIRTIDDADVLIQGDAAALRILVSNGLSNALKFAEHVEVELGVEDGQAVLALDDDGPGVSEEVRASVFEPFVRGQTKRVPGHGLGLALVAHVARWHSGTAELLPSRRRASGARLEVRIPAPDGS